MREVYDIEILPNFFCCCFINYDINIRNKFEISERTNDINNLLMFVENSDYLIGFNNEHFDNLLLKKLIELKEKPLNIILKELVELRDLIINEKERENYDKYKKYKYNHSFNSIDLFLYWSKMLRLSKKLSLKGLGVQINHPFLIELPVDPNKDLELDRFDEVIEYCFNDIEITNKLAHIMSNDINLRLSANTLFGFNSLSWDGVKLGLNILIQGIIKDTNIDEKTVKSSRSYRSKVVLKDIILPNITFDNIHIIDNNYFIQDGIMCFKQPKDIYNYLINKEVVKTDELACRLYYNNSVYDIKSGGIHSVHNPEIITHQEDELLLDIDVSGYYPSLGAQWKFVPEHFKEVLPKIIGNYRDERVAIKKSNPNKAALYKLALNGGFYGNLNSEYTCMYDPQALLSVTINGQLFLLMLIEWLEKENISVLMANTDGLTIKMKKNQREVFDIIKSRWEKLTRMELEEVSYSKMIIMNINNYMAIYSDKSKEPKKKGLLVTKPDLGNSVDFLIIPEALEAYFYKNIPVKEFLLSKTNSEDIYLFCKSPKVDKKYNVWWNNIKQQNLNRFYVSKKGAYIYKQRKKVGSNMENILKGYSVILLNNYYEETIKNRDINYSFYELEINKIINQIQSKQITLW